MIADKPARDVVWKWTFKNLIAEETRIAAGIDQFMALVDQFEK